MYVITFYSFKGGVGRTMALVNVAAELVRRGRKVLVVDFDLEAPGMETYKHLRPPKPHPGIVEYVTEFGRTDQVPNLLQYIYETKPIGKKGGRLWVMPAGRRDRAYRSALTSFDWKRLYQDQDGFLLLEDTKKGWEEELKPDYVLIDSRTGDTDVLGICTRQLPDSVVLMFTPNEQNLAGLENVCRDIRREEAEGLKKKIRLHFVAANVPDLDDEKGILRRQIQAFRERLEFKELSGTIRRYENLSLLDQSIFTVDRPNTKLARTYRHLFMTLVKDNLADRDGALQFLHEYAKRLLPPVARDPHLEVSKKLLNVTAFRQEATDSIFPFTHQIEKIIESFLDDPDVLLRVAECRLLEGQYAPECRTLDGRCDRAKKLLDRVLKIKPDLALAIFWRATCNNRIGDKEAAANDFLEYLRRPGVDPEMAFWAIRELHAIAPNRTQEALRFVDLVVIEDLFYSEEVWDRQLLLDYEEGVARAKGLKVATDADSLILLRRWKEAIKLFPDLEKVEWDTDNEEWDPDKLYSWLMATWGETGILPQTACRRLLELLKEDQISFVTVAAEPLMEAFLLWGAGETEESLRKVNEATEIAQKYKGGGDWDYNYMWFSPWRHRFVSGYQFLDDCQLLRRMFQGEPLRPAFLGPQPSPAPT